jgi:hypothetical protein
MGEDPTFGAALLREGIDTMLTARMAGFLLSRKIHLEHEPVHANRCRHPVFLSTDRDGRPLRTLI